MPEYQPCFAWKDRTAMTMMKYCFLLLLTMLCAGSALAEPDLGEKLTTDPMLKIGHLANGLTYYIRQNKKPENKVELRLLVKVGSLQEDDDQQGLAHFVEHMGFAETRHFKKHELVSWLQSIGVKFGADLGAFTSFDDTIYILPVPSQKPEQLDKAFLVLEDWASGMMFKAEDIASERAVVLEEIRARKSPVERVQRTLISKLMEGTRYPERFPTGTESQVEKVDTSQLQRFYRDWYRPDLMAVIVAGDIDPAAAEQLIERHFAHLTNPPNARALHVASPREWAGPEAIVATEPGAISSTVSISHVNVPTPPYVTSADLQRGLMQELLTQISSHRLNAVTRQANPPYLAGGAMFTPLTPGTANFTSQVAIGSRGIKPALDGLVTEVNRIKRFGFFETELEQGKKNLEARLQHNFNERDKTESAQLAAQYAQHFLRGTPVLSAEKHLAYARALLPGISIQAFNRFALGIFGADGGKLVAYSGIKQPAPFDITAPQLRDDFIEANRLPVAPPKESILPATLLPPPATTATIVAQTNNPELGLTEITLSNGVKVWLKPTEFSNDQIDLGATRPGGSALYQGKHILNAQFATLAVGMMGLGQFTPQQVQEILAGKTARVAANINVLSESMSGNSSKIDQESLLQLVHFMFSTPRRDETAFSLFLNQLSGEFRSFALPEKKLGSDVSLLLLQNNPWLTPMHEHTDLTTLEMDDLIDIYQTRFGSADGFTFVLVGSFDVESIKPLLVQWLGSLPTRPIPHLAPDIPLKLLKGTHKKTLRVGDDSKAIVSLSFTGFAAKQPDTELVQWFLLEILNNRINDILREKLGLIYSGNASGTIRDELNNLFLVSINLPCAPDKVAQVQEAIRAEIRQLQNQGPSLEQMDKIRQHGLLKAAEQRKSNAYWMRYLLHLASTHDKTRQQPNDSTHAMANMTPRQIQHAARTYLDLANSLTVLVNPKP